MGPQAAARTVANRLRLDLSRARSGRALLKADSAPSVQGGVATDATEGKARPVDEAAKGRDALSGKEKPLPALPAE